METKDHIFLALLALGAAFLIVVATKPRRYQGVMANVDVPDATEIIGMSLSPDCNPPPSSPFKGRYVYPAPLASIMPSKTQDATQGTALNQKAYLQ